MAKILVVSMPFAGHVGPMTAVAAELVRRGHEVTAYTGAKYQQRFTTVGATWLPWTKATDYDDADLAATFPEVGDGKGLRGGQANVDHVLFGTAPGQAADILAAGPFDLLVTDQVAFGGAVAGQALGIPWATVAVTPLSLTSESLPPVGAPWPPATGSAGRLRDAALRKAAAALYRRMVDPKLNRLRASVGLGPVPPGHLFDGIYSSHLVLAQGAPGLEYPRADLPSHVHFVGRLALPPGAGVAAELPSWWPDLAAARTVVHVTQGTLDVDLNDLVKPAITALADQDVLVVCTTGGADPAVLGPLPANARAGSFLPHDLLLPEVDVIVTNGGWGGVLAAVQAGIPLVVAGASLDKPEVARRVAWSGAGVNLRTGTPKPAKIAEAVREVTTRPGYRSRAGRLGSAITAAGGADKAADLLEDLLTR
ncbi:glycosyltransferase [Micromonosporaceae bacterium Da 78-11]